MRLFTAMLFGFGVIGCAARGPTDAEVQATLQTRVQDFVRAVGSGDVGSAVAHMSQDATLSVHGIAGPTGQVMNQDIEGTAAIRGFLTQAGAPPDLRMTVSQFTRSGETAAQTGDWSIAGGQQTGTFVLDWRLDDGEWRIDRLRMDGSM